MLGNTPMMLQYEKIKEDYQDCLLFYRLGDFYEMFGPDAERGSKLLGIALTARDGGLGKVPMCGVPFHSAENYIAKIIAAGEKVAICEQVEDPKSSKGIVKREVIRIISPGTVLESNCLSEKNNNYLAALVATAQGYGLAFADASTGEFLATEIESLDKLSNELWRYEPVECLVAFSDEQMYNYLQDFFGGSKTALTRHADYAFRFDYAEQKVKDHFHLQSLDGLGCGEKPLVTIAAGVILDYLQLMHKSKPSNIMNLQVYSLKETMELDYATKRNLELLRSLHGNEKKDSLLGILDYTQTAVGSRLLKSWLEKPLLKASDIQHRLDATEELVVQTPLRNRLKEHLAPIYDLERIVSRVAYGSANAKDLLALKNSLALLPEVEKDLAACQSNYAKQLSFDFDPLADIYQLLEESIHPEAPFSLREGNLIKQGYNQHLDELRDVLINGKNWLVEIEQRERERTGIKTLKVSYNKVFGYYIDVSRAKSNEVPAEYIRKQTLANSERFITPELKELEQKILGADEKSRELEYQLFVAVRSQVNEHIPRILQTAHILAQLDCLYALAQAAVYHNFVKPTISQDGTYQLKACRHPVVEQKLQDSWFVPNDVYFDREEQRFLIITGPNMAGKSTYCRSIALATILMQIGSYVPAEEACLPVVDRVFARIGASDDLSTGQSTFMVEMNEVANIVNNATKDSLIILDEVGRGTSTYDGLAIAWALTDYINQKIQAKTLFATHYHELTVLEEQPGIKNYSVAVKEDGENIVFLRKIVPGGADRSYGIHVAQLAGVPKVVLRQAKAILQRLEIEKGPQEPRVQQLDLFTPVQEVSPLVRQIAELDLLNMTGRDALNLLYDLQEKAKDEMA
ncbi:MAG: DNA mismatch repair protein MutS [Peptococcaceae bacterium]|nr:DNA mismatch repair protein MutS [Peptococcaceae bacterium]